MAISLKHLFQSAKTDGPDNTIVQPSDWNDEHVLTQATGKLLGRTTAGVGPTEEIAVGGSLSLSTGTLDVSSINLSQLSQSSATTGQVVTWSGSAWIAQTPTTGVSSFNTRTGAITLSSSDVTTALAYTPVNKAGDTMSGALIVSASTSGDLVRITQTGSGNALVVEDSANPDATSFVVNTDGNVGVGTNSPGSYRLNVQGSSVPMLVNSSNNSNVLALSSAGTVGGYLGASGTNLIASRSDGNEAFRIESSGAVRAVEAFVMPTPFSFRNKIINGHFLWDQRGGGTVWAGGVANTQTYTLDRWFYVQTLASKFTLQRQLSGGPTNLASYLRITSSAATTPSSSAIYVVAQKIEAANMFDTAWGASTARTMTLSFWVRSSLTGTFGGALFNANADRNYVFSYSINAANTWEYKTITIAGPTSGTWDLTSNGTGLQIYFDLGAGTSSRGTAGSWGTSTNFYGPTGATNVIGTNGATWDLTGVQFELGSVATPFELPDVGIQFQQIQRYYQVQNTLEYHMCPAPGATYASTYPVHFPVVMRTTPTLAFSYATSNAIGSYVSAIYNGPRGFVHFISASVSTNAYMSFVYTASAEL